MGLIDIGAPMPGRNKLKKDCHGYEGSVKGKKRECEGINRTAWGKTDDNDSFCILCFFSCTSSFFMPVRAADSSHACYAGPGSLYGSGGRDI